MIQHIFVDMQAHCPYNPASAWSFVILERERKNTPRKLRKIKNFEKTYSFQRNYVILSSGFFAVHNYVWRIQEYIKKK